jgi:hypothetical protein
MESFQIAPAETRLLWLVPALVGLVLVVVVAIVGRSLAGATTSRFVLSPAGLQLHGDWYGRTIPPGRIRVGESRRVDFTAEPDLSPTRRSLGTGLPGYQAGWFRLRNGERALLYLTDRTRAVYVPTDDGYSLLLSPSEPEAFLKALRALGSGR